MEVYEASASPKARNIFTKPQRKTISQWKDQAMVRERGGGWWGSMGNGYWEGRERRKSRKRGNKLSFCVQDIQERIRQKLESKAGSDNGDISEPPSKVAKVDGASKWGGRGMCASFKTYP